MESCSNRVKLGNLLPPAFVLSVIGACWLIYVCFHLRPVLNIFTPEECFAVSVRLFSHDCRGLWQALLSSCLNVMMLVCYFKAALTGPGGVPDTIEWQLSAGEADLPCLEAKQTGERRHCKWCHTFKPDRCHHCRQCNACVLRMDHHCPWITNCVGFHNYKYFYLLVLYALLSCCFTAGTVLESVALSVEEEVPGTERFQLIVCIVFAGILGGLMFFLFVLHTWLISQGMTTIEFCEKQYKQDSQGLSYYRGVRKNIESALGPRPLLWLLPCSPPEGDGINFKRRNVPDVGEALRDPEWTTLPR